MTNVIDTRPTAKNGGCFGYSCRNASKVAARGQKYVKTHKLVQYPDAWRHTYTRHATVRVFTVAVNGSLYSRLYLDPSKMTPWQIRQAIDAGILTIDDLTPVQIRRGLREMSITPRMLPLAKAVEVTL